MGNDGNILHSLVEAWRAVRALGAASRPPYGDVRLKGKPVHRSSFDSRRRCAPTRLRMSGKRCRCTVWRGLSSFGAQAGEARGGQELRGERGRWAGEGRCRPAGVPRPFGAASGIQLDAEEGRAGRRFVRYEHWFLSLPHARSVVEEWRLDCNLNRPHSSLGNLTLEEFRLDYAKRLVAAGL